MEINSELPESDRNSQTASAYLAYETDEQSEEHVCEYLIVGAGMVGVIMLAEAVQLGITDVILLDKQQSPGGLWNLLPAWQTVQNSVGDFCIQGFRSRKKTWHGADVANMLQRYIAVQKLEPYLHMGRALEHVDFSQKTGRWTLKTRVEGPADGASGPRYVTYQCHKLIMCTGKHAVPIVPSIAKDDGSVEVLHSSQVKDFGPYRGKNVVVVGAGASGLDLLTNTLRANEDVDEGERGHKVYWVARQRRYFGVGVITTILPLTVVQLLFGRLGLHMASLYITCVLRLVFWLYGCGDWLPDGPFDLEKEQFVPNRGHLLTYRHRIDREEGVEIAAISGRSVTLSNGRVIEDVDAVLLGTGYGGPKYHPNLDMHDDTPFWAKVAPLNRHKGRLFVVGDQLLDTTGSTPIDTHLSGRTALGAITDEDVLSSMETKYRHLIFDRNYKLNHLDMFNHVPSTFASTVLSPTILWRFRMLAVHLYYRWVYGTRVFTTDRVLGTNMYLD